jgi:hypothetical protein
MKRSVTIAMFGGVFALSAAQACSSEDDSPSGSSSGSDASSSTSSSSTSSSSSGDTTSSSSSGTTVTNTCTPAGGVCFCGTLSTACPHGGRRDGQYKCPAPRAGSDECVSTCCLDGDAAVNPPSDAGQDAEADADGG